MKKNIYKSAARFALGITIVAMLGRLGGGSISGILLLLGIWAALTRRRGLVLSCFILYPVLLTLNPFVFPMAATGTVINRISTFVVALLMAIVATKEKGSNQLPLGGIMPFLLVATVSSINGYFPQISYLKIINFGVFVLGLWIGSQNLQNTPMELEVLRAFILGLTMFVICGSFILYLIYPSAAYFQNVSAILREGGADVANEALASVRDFGVSLFAGVTNQSQCLGPMLAGLTLWLACDMLFIEQHFNKFHMLLFLLGIVEMYMTRSRTSLLGFIVGSTIIMIWVLRHTPLQSNLKRRVRMLAQMMMIIMLIAAVASEVWHSGMSKWIRKASDESIDDRSLIQAITASREGLIEQNWMDFHYNETLGCGFQVAYFHPYLYGGKTGLIFSAPIEKGVLPLMVLGETGVIGFVFFMLFIVSFYSVCARKRLFVTIALFSVLIATNFGEADFFSPGGIGGAKWVICVVGGFVIDTYLLVMQRIRKLTGIRYI